MCTRVYNNKDRNYLSTARNMDWMEELRTTLFAYDRGLNKSGLENGKGLKWKSKYKSVVAIVGDPSSYAAADGINSNGLVVNTLYDANAQYSEQTGKDDELSILRLVQYILDKYERVDIAVKKLNKSLNIKKSVKIVNAIVPGAAAKPATLHISISDRYGDSAIIEMKNDETVFYNDVKTNIMTNDPGYQKQIQLMSFWQWQWSIENNDRTKTMPGSPVASDRFARALLYYNQLSEPTNMQESLFQSKSIVMNASVPLGYKGDPESPYISNTIWSTISNHRDNIYYFANARTPSTIWIELNLVDFSKHRIQSLNVVDIVDSKPINKVFEHINITKQLKSDVDPFGCC